MWRFACVLILVISIFSCQDYEKFHTTTEIAVDNQKLIDSIKVAIKADEKSERLLEVFREKVKYGFNGSFLVAQSGITLIDTMYGFANFEKGIQLNKESGFQLASLSKTFTAISILKLVQEGKLSLDLTVKDYYPEFPYEGVTLRSLLSHRSGLPYYEYSFDQKVRSENLFPDNQDIMKWFSESPNPPKPFNLPDHFFSYNNTNFAILAAIIEKVSQKSYDTFLEEEIFKPLGMEHSRVSRGLTDSTANRTFGYQNGQKIAFDHFDNVLGDKGLISNTSDLLKWYQALRGEKIVNKELLREAYTPRSFEYPGLRNYGYGFRLWLNEKQQTDYIYHTGWWKGYNTIMFFDLREDFVIILLSNRYNKDVYHIKEVIDIMHGKAKNTSVEENILDE